MERPKNVQNWLDSAEYDWQTAEILFVSGRYVYTVFLCHLALEKALKAKVEQNSCRIPPKTHDLQHLVALGGLHPTEEVGRFLAEIGNLSVVTRYPEDFHKMVRAFSKDRTKLILEKTREVLTWIKTCMRS